LPPRPSACCSTRSSPPGPATVATAQELAAVWRGLRRSDILPLRLATLIGALAGRREHLIPDRALRRLAARHLQFERLEQAVIPLHLIAFDLLAGTEVRLSDGPMTDAVLAAAAILGVLPPVRWRGRLLADGGIADNTPVSHAVALGASTCCSPRTPATAACRAHPGLRWPPQCTRSSCSPTPRSVGRVPHSARQRSRRSS
jgi:predicted acylesterase/phospholipase RssA